MVKLEVGVQGMDDRGRAKVRWEVIAIADGDRSRGVIVGQGLVATEPDAWKAAARCIKHAATLLAFPTR